MATQEEARTKVFQCLLFFNNVIFSQFTESQFDLRNPSTHAVHCSELEVDEDASREHGINRDSILNTLRYKYMV